MHIQPFHRLLARFVLSLAILAGAVGASVLPATATRQVGVGSLPQQTEGDEPPIFLPLLTNFPPARVSVFGTETNNLGPTTTDLMAEAGVYWTRNATISWAEIEPERTDPPTYNWEAVDEAGIISVTERRLSLVATIKDTPLWAQKVPGHYCGPVAPEAMDEFAQFVRAVVARYSVRPYHVRYWELGNEPDVDPSLVFGDSVFGCWGDKNDPYYGGGYYATMLKRVYPAAKLADPSAQIVVGGLLLDCDWTNPPKGKDCTPSKFLEGILRNGGGSYFDLVGFHSFANYTGRINEDSQSWLARGGTMVGKISFLRETMAKYGVNKPLLMNESAMVCPEWMGSECSEPVSANFLEMQANYISWLYVRGWAYNLKGVIWYTIEDNGWRFSGLSLKGVPKPAYRALQFTSTKLDGARYIRTITAYPSISAYEFSKPSELVWVMWSADQTNRAITLPANTIQVFDKYGTVIKTGGGAITVNSPIYVELAP